MRIIHRGRKIRLEISKKGKKGGGERPKKEKKRNRTTVQHHICATVPTDVQNQIYHPPKQAEKGRTKTSRAQLCHRAATVKTLRRRVRRQASESSLTSGTKNRPMPTDGFIRRNAAMVSQTPTTEDRRIYPPEHKPPHPRSPRPRVLASLASSNAWELTQYPFAGMRQHSCKNSVLRAWRNRMRQHYASTRVKTCISGCT